jgi:hypothetical protein
MLLGPASGRAEGMPETLADAKRMEQAVALPAPGFYFAPRALSRTRPGDLLDQQPFDGYQVPPGRLGDANPIPLTRCG